jgi:hypothetical protein
VVGTEHRRVTLDAGVNFFSWASKEWPEPRYSVSLAPQLGVLAAGDAQHQVVAELAQEVALLRRDVDASMQARPSPSMERLAARMATEKMRRDREERVGTLLLPRPEGTRIDAPPDPGRRW